jgi:hypothetical protein
MDCSFRTGDWLESNQRTGCIACCVEARCAVQPLAFLQCRACGLLTGWHLAPTNTRIKPGWEIGVGGVQVPARRERAAIGRQSVDELTLTVCLSLEGLVRAQTFWRG